MGDPVLIGLWISRSKMLGERLKIRLGLLPRYARLEPSYHPERTSGAVLPPILRLVTNGRLCGEGVPHVRQVAEDCSKKSFWHHSHYRELYVFYADSFPGDIGIGTEPPPIRVTQDRQCRGLVVLATREHAS